MSGIFKSSIPRRKFLKASAAAAAGLSVAPYLNCGKNSVSEPMKREFGRLNVEVTSLGLGGQASLQWTPSDIDPVPIILKAFQQNINYYDTSNLYAGSQLNFGKAFRTLDLIPGQSGYDERLRKSIFLTSKTALRYAKGAPDPGARDIFNHSNDRNITSAVDDVKRTVSQIFGDGNGNYPPEAYLDMVLTHNITYQKDVDAVYEGLDNPDPGMERIGAFAGLLDLRDGTNLTGLNPKEEKLINHIGFSGHQSPDLHIQVIQRDERDILDAMLVAINANDRLNFNMQYNAIPLATAKNMGVIAMKVFADGAMYTKPAGWTQGPDQVVRTVGSPELSSRPLVEYSLTTPGVHVAIIGTGQINDDSLQCQLMQNLSAAQINPNELSQTERREIEQLALRAKEGKTNYFQSEFIPLGAPRNPSVSQEQRNNQRVVKLAWHMAYAGNEPIKQYEIWRDNEKVAEVAARPQVSLTPFTYEDSPGDRNAHSYRIVTVDVVDRNAETEGLSVGAMQ